MPSTTRPSRQAEFFALVHRYQTLVTDAIARIEKVYGAASIDDVLDDRVPWSGELPGLTFHYHGTGCTAVLDGSTVQWDWIDGRTDHLDVWALAQLTRDRESEFGVWADRVYVREFARGLHEEGLLEEIVPRHTYRVSWPASLAER